MAKDNEAVKQDPKKRYVINTPYTHFTGVREGVSFHLGIAQTEDAEVASRLRDLGYRVEEVGEAAKVGEAADGKGGGKADGTGGEPPKKPSENKPSK